MFTGIIEAIGVVQSLSKIQDEWRLKIDCAQLDTSDVKLGDSIAVSGCCLTVVELDQNVLERMFLTKQFAVRH